MACVLGAASDAPARDVRGCVRAADSGAPVAGARLTVLAAGAVNPAASGSGGRRANVAPESTSGATRDDGCFVVSLEAGAAALVVDAPGFAPVTVALTDVGPADLEVRLQRARFSERVDVSATSADATGDGAALLPLRPVEVAALAGGAENVFRVLQTLPGVAATEEFGSRLAVRGGTPDQNLTVMDGVEIHNPYRLFGLVSAFNPETVSRFELTAGAFDARHGDRLSSLLVVENRAGRDDRRLAGSSSLSLTDGNVLAEGKLPGRARGSWLVTGRRTYYDLVAERFTGDDLPSFGDVQAKLVLEPRPGQRLALYGVRSRETTDAEVEFDRPGEGGTFVTDASNDVGALSFDASLGRRAAWRSVLSWYRNGEGLDVDANARNEARRSNAPGDEGFTQADIVFARELSVRDSALRQQLTWQAGPRLLLETGGELHRLRTRVAWRIDGDRNPSEANGSSVRGGAGLPDRLDSSYAATRLGAFVQARAALGARLTLEPGLRLDRSSVNRETTLAPRLSAAWAFSPTLRLRAASGLYTQSPGYEKLIQSDYFFDLSGDQRLDLRHERSWQALLGLEREWPGEASARVEAWVKTFDRLTLGRLETPSDVAARLAPYDFPEVFSTSLPREPRITSVPVSTGEGRAYGVDLFLTRRDAPARRLSGWLAYSLGKAERTSYGRSYPFEYDRRHALSLVANWRARRRLDVAVTARLASGFPRTPVAGLRVAERADTADRDADGNRTELVPWLDASGLPVYTIDLGGVSNLNSGRLPAFARVDLRATFFPGGRQGRWTLYLDVINVLNRDNAGQLDPQLVHDPGAEQPRLVEERLGGIPLLPSLGVRFRF
jgi:hypothetical protein